MLLELSKNDRICFLGDSITSNGLWIAEVFEYFRDKFPELKIGFYNCGISGSKGSEADLKNRLYCDCFNFFPRYLVIMFGMNDAMPYLYSPGCREENKEQKRSDALTAYKNGLLRVIGECEKNGITPIICAPTPYDEYNSFEAENWQGDIALRRCGEIAADLAGQYGLLFVNMHEILLENIEKKPIGADRIHPNGFGQHLMAERFLCAIGAKENADADCTVTLCEKNRQRFKTEQDCRALMFVERDYMLWQHGSLPDTAERKRLLTERIKTETADWADSILNKYLKYADYKEELRGELVRLTVGMYR